MLFTMFRTLLEYQDATLYEWAIRITRCNRKRSMPDGVL